MDVQKGKKVRLKQAIAKEESKAGSMFSNARQGQGRAEQEDSYVKVTPGGIRSSRLVKNRVGKFDMHKLDTDLRKMPKMDTQCDVEERGV